jgi:hypothetical protein
MSEPPRSVGLRDVPANHGSGPWRSTQALCCSATGWRHRVPPLKTFFQRAVQIAATIVLPLSFVALIVFVVRLSHGDESTTVLGQPRVERAAQRDLPQSSDPMWRLLRTTQIREDEAQGTFSAVFPSAIRRLAGRTVTIRGYMLPLESKTETHHFLLSKRTPVCQFCPPGEPDEVIEVFSPNPIVPTTSQVLVTGLFGFQRDSGAGLFFRLDDAEATWT